MSNERKTVKLGDVASFLKGKGLSKDEIVPNGRRECIHYGELFTKYNENIRRVISRTDLEGSLVLSKVNDVLMPTSDVTPRGLSTASYINKEGVILGGDVLIIRPDPSKLFGLFFAHYVRANKHRIIRLVAGSTVFHLYGSDLKKLQLSLPPLNEQKRIVEILETWQEYLKDLDQKIEYKINVKRGLMQQLLHGNKRLPGFSKAWEEVKLGDLFKITSSKRVFEADWKSEGVPFYRAREVIKLRDHGHVDNELFITKAMFDEYKAKYGSVKKNDILVTGVGTVGVAYRVQDFTDFYFKDGNIIWLKDQGKASSEYIEQLFKSDIIKRQIHRFTPITTVATYTIEMANSTKLMLPPRDEQDAISEVLSNADREITDLKRLRALAAKQKDYLASNLINGDPSQLINASKMESQHA
jgi:type I restriction enzyme S subunit